jgi:hypothetical protein
LDQRSGLTCRLDGHQSDRRELDHGFGVAVVPCQAAVADQPAEGSFNHPPAPLHLETRDVVAARDIL